MAVYKDGDKWRVIYRYEIIIIATDNAMTVEELKETVCYVNRNELRQEEILSDNVYRFCRSDGNVEII